MSAANAIANAEADDRRDERLRRALAHAPDQNAVPDWRLRQSILRKAHDAVGATDADTDSAELERAARPWWRGEATSVGRTRRRWSAVLASALVAGSLVVYWQRQPAPGPRIDAVTTTIAALPSPLPAPSVLPAPGMAPAPGDAPASSAAPASAEPPQPEPVAPEPVLPPLPLPPAPAPLAPLAMAPAPADSSPFPFVDLAPIPATPAAPAAPAIAAAVPTVPVPVRKPSSTVRTDETDPPTFVALSTWSRITINRRGGESRSLSRAEARELNALLGSAALSAVGPRPLGGTPEWRVTLERGAESLAVFEIAGSQVRWREGKTPPGTGVPSGPALAALREALQAAVQPASEAAAAPPEPPRSP